MEKQLNWKIYFYDKREGIITKTNLDTDTLEDGSLDLPILPVILILNIRRDVNGTRFSMEARRNFYCLIAEDDEWWASTYSGLLNYIDFYRGNGAILRGGMVPNSLFHEAYEKAKIDPQILAVTQELFERDPGEAFD